MLKEFLQRNRLPIALVVALLVINVIVFLFFTQPKLDTEAFNRERISEVEARHSELSRILGERREFLDFLESNNQALETFYEDTLGTRQQKQTEVLANREAISKQFGIIPSQVSYNTNPVRDMPLERLEMNFPLVGTYESLRFFMDNLETSEDFLIIDDVELSSSSTEGEGMNMRISVATLFYDPAGSQDGEEDDE